MAAPRICSVDCCDKPVEARGWCGKHYRRWKTHGDPLAVSYPTPARNFFEREVLGHDGEGCLFWPYSKSAAGYGQVSINRQLRYVHRLVCECVHGPAPTPTHEAAHSCGNGHLGCCAKGHLSWKTRRENSADMVVHGTIPRGERHGSSKLTENQVREIRELTNAHSQSAIAKQFGVSPTTISEIHNRKIWGWLE